MASNDPKEFLIQHGEKVALGVALAVTAFFVATTFTGSDAGKTNQEVASQNQQIRNKLNKGITSKQAAADPLATVKGEWGKLKAGALADNWTFYRVPQIKLTHEKGAEPIYVTDPSGLTATASREQITVNWSSPPMTTDKGAGRADLKGYILYKWRKGDSKKQAIFQGAGSTSYVDRQFEPKTTYCYQLVAHFEYERKGEPGKTPQVRGGTEGVGPEGAPYKGEKIRVSEMTKEACATTQVNIQLVFRNYYGSKAVIWVWQYWKDGTWWGVKFQIEPGGDIGEMVSALKIVTDNRRYNEGAASFAQLQQESRKAEGRKPKYSWETGHIFLGTDKSGKKAYIEVADAGVFGLGGIDWGYKYTEIKRVKKVEKPK